jgi:uncharacterized protein (AIM24 family)
MSTLRVTTLQNLSGTEVYTAKAWVNFNGTGTVAIRAAGNVSSITDNNTGDYTVNFTTAFSDTNYNVVGGVSTASGSNNILSINSNASAAIVAPTSSACRIASTNRSAGNPQDAEYVSVSFFR